MTFYWDERDREDQEYRRRINEGRIYTDGAFCDFCKVPLLGHGFQCEVCNALACASCVCDDGRCPTCTVAAGGLRR